MDSMHDLVLLGVFAVLIFGSTWVGLAWGRRVPEERHPERDHLGTLQSALLGLLALLLGFAFSGAMSRLGTRQDALAREAASIEAAYAATSLMPSGDEARGLIRGFAQTRLALFNAHEAAKEAELVGTLHGQLKTLTRVTIASAQASPGLGQLFLPSMESIRQEFSARNAIAKRHLPAEFLVVMLACSCVAMGTIAFGVGIAKRRSVGSLMALAFLVTTTLFLTMDFDRPKRGMIRLDPTPLVEVIGRISS